MKFTGLFHKTKDVFSSTVYVSMLAIVKEIFTFYESLAWSP